MNAANLQLDDKQRTIIMQWFYVRRRVCWGVGLLLGLVLPHLVPSRKTLKKRAGCRAEEGECGKSAA
ncbi:hypothetical protein A7K92_27790 [Klebsiella pneumoniae]|nr:hypothetical protein A7K92_27790 [Klebsiella pneumoniae]